MLNYLDIFDVEEQEVINRTTQNEDLRIFSRNELISKLDFVLVISTDADIVNLYEGLKFKISNLTDEEWSKVRAILPFTLLYSDEDRVPIDEVI